MAGAKREGEGEIEKRESGESPSLILAPQPPSFFPSSFSPTPFDAAACYTGYFQQFFTCLHIIRSLGYDLFVLSFFLWEYLIPFVSFASMSFHWLLLLHSRLSSMHCSSDWDHLRSKKGIVYGRGSFAVLSGDHLRYSTAPLVGRESLTAGELRSENISPKNFTFSE